MIDLAKLVAIRLLMLADAFLRFAKPRQTETLHRMNGDIEPGSRKTICLFAHFDRDGLIDDYVVYYLSKLEALGCETVFVSTAAIATRTELEKVRPFCRTIIVRENLGHDFGSWKVGFAEIGDPTRYDRLVIANDSVYGPIFDLGDVFAKMDRGDAGFWGITDSHRYRHHVQSYFVVFERAVLASAAFARFWRKLPNYRFKHSVILGCEVGLSRCLARAGFRFRVLCPIVGVRKKSGKQHLLRNGWRALIPSTNSTHWNWETLLTDYKCPFLKVQLLRDNPKKVHGIERWPDIVSCVAAYDSAIIRRHLARFATQES